MKRTHRLAVLPGDGIGPEVVGEALRVLDLVSTQEGFEMDLVHIPDSGDHYLRTGELMTPSTIDSIRSCQSMLLGAIGHPTDHTSHQIMQTMVDEFDLSIGVRHAFLHHADLSPLKGADRGDVDIVIVRPTNEGEIRFRGGSLNAETPYETAVNLDVHSRFGVERVLRHGFGLARKRHKRLAVVSQANANPSHRIFETALADIREDFPDVEATFYYPDAAAMQFILEPTGFDVVATTLTTGGIYADLLGALVGGIGLIGSTRWNPDTKFGLYEPAHGSAPKYTGQNKVSPLATLKALAMLLDNLGEGTASQRVDGAIDEALRTRAVPSASTRSPLGTTGATDAVLAALAANRTEADLGWRQHLPDVPLG